MLSSFTTQELIDELRLRQGVEYRFLDPDEWDNKAIITSTYYNDEEFTACQIVIIPEDLDDEEQ